jgi:hypothetical protein
MMRWTPNTTTDVSEVREDGVVQEFLASVVGAVAGLGGRSVVVAAMVALIVLTLVFGLSADDALAGARYCKLC